MPSEPRDYQAPLFPLISAEFVRGRRRVLLVAPTGSGKGFMIAWMAMLALARGRRVYIFVHRGELLDQLSASLRLLDVRHGRIQPGWPKSDWLVQIGMIQTVARRLDKYDAPDFVIFDEAHHVVASQYQKVIEYWPNAYVVGYTATPLRLDGRGLGRAFDSMVTGPGVRELIDAGWLADYDYYAPPTRIDLSTISIRGGDYATDELAAETDKPKLVGDLIEHYKTYLDRRAAIAFAVRVDHAEHIAEQARAAGIAAVSVDGQTPEVERKARISGLGNGNTELLCSCDLVGEGLDIPIVAGAILARRTKSLARFLQWCVDSETEILSYRGWLRHNELLPTDVVASFDVKTGECHWSDIDEIILRPLHGKEGMFGLASPQLDIRVTQYHDMVVRGCSPTCVNWRKEHAEKSAARKGMFVIPVCGASTVPDCILSDDEIRFIGWFLTDGTITKDGRRVTISQSVTKTTHCDEIHRVMRSCGLGYSTFRVRRKMMKYADLLQFGISKGNPRGARKHLRGFGALSPWLDKSIPRIFEGLSDRQARVLLSAMNLGDGRNADNSITWTRATFQITCGNNEEMANRLQSLFVRRGLRCNITTHLESESRIYFTINVSDKPVSSIAGLNDKDGNIEGKPYKRSRFAPSPSIEGEMVWCVSTRLGTIVTRRNGKVAILGNCGRVLRPKPDGSRAVLLDHAGNIHEGHGMPDAVRAWTLDDKKRKPASEPVHTCERCYRVFAGGANWRAGQDCEYPGEPGCILNPDDDAKSEWKPPEAVDGQLEVVTSFPAWGGGIHVLNARGREWNELLARADTFAKLEEIRRARGYSAYWTRHVMAARSKAKARA